jgi:hypothetical protein
VWIEVEQLLVFVSDEVESSFGDTADDAKAELEVEELFELAELARFNLFVAELAAHKNE